jgi:hypothetical protein
MLPHVERFRVGLRGKPVSCVNMANCEAMPLLFDPLRIGYSKLGQTKAVVSQHGLRNPTL